MASDRADLVWATTSLAWSMVGLFAGYLLGRLSVDVREVREAIVGEPVPVNDDTPRRATARRGAQNLLGLLLIVLAVLSLTGTALTLNRQSEQVHCQTRWNQQFSASLTERTKAAAADRQALNDLVSEVARNLADPTRQSSDNQAAALKRYLDAVAASDRQREQNPLPASPAQVCG